jgi:hypothetical protein
MSLKKENKSHFVDQNRLQVFEPQTLFDNIVRHHVSQASENTASMSD